MDEKLNKPEPKRIRLFSVADVNEEDVTIAPTLPQPEIDVEFQPNDPARLDKTKIAGTIQK